MRHVAYPQSIEKHVTQPDTRLSKTCNTVRHKSELGAEHRKACDIITRHTTRRVTQTQRTLRNVTQSDTEGTVKHVRRHKTQ